MLFSPLRVQRVVEAAEGKIGVIACGNFGESTKEQIEAIKQIYHYANPDAIAIIPSLLVHQSASLQLLKDRLTEIRSETEEMVMGLYETDHPYYRHLPPSAIEWAVEHLNFTFLIDRSTSNEEIKKKGGISLKNNKLQIFSGNITLLDAALQSNYKGFAGPASNFYPDVLVWYYNNCVSFKDSLIIQRFMSVAQNTLDIKYPMSAKVYLRLFQKGIARCDIFCRSLSTNFSEKEIHTLMHLKELSDFILESTKEQEKKSTESVLL